MRTSTYLVPAWIQRSHNAVFQPSSQIDVEDSEMEQAIVRQGKYFDLIAVGKQSRNVPVALDVGALCGAWILVPIHPFL